MFEILPMPNTNAKFDNVHIVTKICQHTVIHIDIYRHLRCQHTVSYLSAYSGCIYDSMLTKNKQHAFFY